jgi:hypothetical protein
MECNVTAFAVTDGLVLAAADILTRNISATTNRGVQRDLMHGRTTKNMFCTGVAAAVAC